MLLTSLDVKSLDSVLTLSAEISGKVLGLSVFENYLIWLVHNFNFKFSLRFYNKYIFLYFAIAECTVLK